MAPLRLCGVFAALAVLVTCEPPPGQRPADPDRLYPVDAGGRPLTDLEAGSTLHIGAGRLEPNRIYEVRLGIDVADVPSREEAVSFARLNSGPDGRIDPFVLWYHSGVVGCSVPERNLDPSRHMYRSFDEAEASLADSRLTVSIHPVDRDASPETPLMQIGVGRAEYVFDLPVARRESPMVYPSDSSGCLLNSQETRTGDMFVSGRNFQPGEEVLVSVVPNQRAWYVGDAVEDMTGERGAPASLRAVADAEGRFTISAWGTQAQRRGVYDIVAQRELDTRVSLDTIAIQDIISYGIDTGFILFLRYPVGGPTMDIAGRKISGSPYFEFSDSFADQADTVWGAVDPTYVPTTHPGGMYAAYYVVDHRSVAGWDPTMGGSTSLTDVSGGIEVMPVKAGCINGTDTPIWIPPLTLGDYDVVVDFGSTVANVPSDYTTDSNYDDAQDFLDGADQIGFIVAEDPYELGTTPIGRLEYSQDDYFTTLGGASNVDLRAVVRYPATSAGDGTAVAAGQHPLFIIEHGNHRHCEVDTGGAPIENLISDYVSGTITWGEFVSRVPTHATCTVRTENHKGYMRLLDILASHGVIAVSIDAYDLTGFNFLISGWIPERGDLILKHIELWSHMNDTTTFTTYPDPSSGLFTGHVDMNEISVSGHSRGGEASVAAYDRNTTFNIGSVSSIAPVDFEGYVLDDVPYFVILPAGDGDVSNLSGIKIYDRAGSTLTPTEDATTKSGIHLYGANHNFFNTIWAAHGDDSSPTRDDYIAAPTQQKLGEAYLAAFARSNLLGEGVYDDMFRGRLIFPSTVGLKNYHMRHETQHARHENGSGSGTVGGATGSPITGPSVHVTQAVRVTWTSASDTLRYALPAGARDASPFEVLSFRVAQTNSGTNPAAGSQDFLVELTGGGVTRGFWVSRFDEIPKPYDHPDYASDHNVMTTVRIPLHSYIMNRSGFPLTTVDTIRFLFQYPTQGDIYVDDIEFSR